MNIKIILSLFAILLLSNSLFAQGKKNQTIIITTSAQCEMCKERIEKELIYTSGIKKAELNMDDKSVTVTFQGKRITADEIRTILSELGYDADEVKANQDAYSKLPNCCKKAEDRTGSSEMH